MLKPSSLSAYKLYNRLHLNSHIRIAKIGNSPPLTISHPYRKGCNETCPERERRPAIAVRMRWKHSVAGISVALQQKRRMGLHFIVLAPVVVPEDLENLRRGLERDDRLDTDVIGIISWGGHPGS